MSQLDTQTIAARQAVDTDTQWGAVIPPLHLSSTYSFAGLNAKREYDYSRSGNPTRDQLGDCLSALEGGAGTTVTSSGMAACNLVLELLQAGDTLLAPDDCYGGCRRLFNARQRKSNLELITSRFSDTAQVIEAIERHRPRMVWIETPSNPLLRLTDIEAVADAAHAVDALVVADNTFLSPVLQTPLALGADIVLHSTTKYINGHSDVVGGAVIGGSTELAEEIQWWGNCTGVTGSPFDAYQTLRGVRTLPLRIRQHEHNARSVAKFLDRHARVSTVYYPGLAHHPGHELACRQQKGFGAIVSLETDFCATELADFLAALKLFTLAESLGGVESLIAHPASMTHAAMTADEQRIAGIGPNLLRLSIGVENPDDLLADLDQAFAAVGRQRKTTEIGHAA